VGIPHQTIQIKQSKNNHSKLKNLNSMNNNDNLHSQLNDYIDRIIKNIDIFSIED